MTDQELNERVARLRGWKPPARNLPDGRWTGEMKHGAVHTHESGLTATIDEIAHDAQWTNPDGRPVRSHEIPNWAGNLKLALGLWADLGKPEELATAIAEEWCVMREGGGETNEDVITSQLEIDLLEARAEQAEAERDRLLAEMRRMVGECRVCRGQGEYEYHDAEGVGTCGCGWCRTARALLADIDKGPAK